MSKRPDIQTSPDEFGHILIYLPSGGAFQPCLCGQGIVPMYLLGVQQVQYLVNFEPHCIFFYQASTHYRRPG